MCYLFIFIIIILLGDGDCPPPIFFFGELMVWFFSRLFLMFFVFTFSQKFFQYYDVNLINKILVTSFFSFAEISLKDLIASMGFLFPLSTLVSGIKQAPSGDTRWRTVDRRLSWNSCFPVTSSTDFFLFRHWCSYDLTTYPDPFN